MPWVIALVLPEDVNEAEALEIAHTLSREQFSTTCYEVGQIPEGHYALPPKGKRYCFHGAIKTSM